MTTDTKTFEDFVSEQGIAVAKQEIIKRDGVDFHKHSAHYRVTLERNGQTFVVDYSVGPGIYWGAHKRGDFKHPAIRGRIKTRINLADLPRYKDHGLTIWEAERFPLHLQAHAQAYRVPAVDVLMSVASDSSEAFSTFEDWADAYGYDSDSRKAEATYRACQEIAMKLRRWLGEPLFSQLLECEE